MTRLASENDKVTRLIQYCHSDRQRAEDLFQHLITEDARRIELPEGLMTLTQDEHDEFVERYSSEVEPTLWESKRLKH